MAKKTVECCPHCGGRSGVFIKKTYVNVPFCFGFNNETQDNSEMYDNAEKYLDGNMVYCQDCSKAICRLSTLEKQWGG